MKIKQFPDMIRLILIFVLFLSHFFLSAQTVTRNDLIWKYEDFDVRFISEDKVRFVYRNNFSSRDISNSEKGLEVIHFKNLDQALNFSEKVLALLNMSQRSSENISDEFKGVFYIGQFNSFQNILGGGNVDKKEVNLGLNRFGFALEKVAIHINNSTSNFTLTKKEIELLYKALRSYK